MRIHSTRTIRPNKPTETMERLVETLTTKRPGCMFRPILQRLLDVRQRHFQALGIWVCSKQARTMWIAFPKCVLRCVSQKEIRHDIRKWVPQSYTFKKSWFKLVSHFNISEALYWSSVHGQFPKGKASC